MDNPITDALIEQFARSWRELRDAVAKFPADEWRQGPIDYLVPARLAYHIIATADMYATSMGYEAYKPHRAYKLDWEAAPVEDLPAREAFLSLIDETEGTVKAWLLEMGDEGLLQAQTDYAWTGEQVLGRALYTLRHSQWHIGELNAILRSRGFDQVEW